MFREFCFSRVQKMVLCASAYDKFLYDDLFFFSSSECFLLFRFVYDERNVATTMNEPVIVTWENATIYKIMFMTATRRSNSIAAQWSFVWYNSFALLTFVHFRSEFLAGFRVWIYFLRFVVTVPRFFFCRKSHTFSENEHPEQWMRWFYGVLLCYWKFAGWDTHQNPFVRPARRLIWERETRLPSVQRHLVRPVVVGRG